MSDLTDIQIVTRRTTNMKSGFGNYMPLSRGHRICPFPIQKIKSDYPIPIIAPFSGMNRSNETPRKDKNLNFI